ncbi:MAG: hypothetical protein IKM00_03745, partial [Clostridia bacterium]|nr:hypothetical protein [Clostridia bacterium]
ANQSAFAQSPAGFAVLCSRTHRRSNRRLVCFFLQLFLSNKEKVDRFPLSKGKTYENNSVGRQRKSKRFALRFLNMKNLIFFRFVKKILKKECRALAIEISLY